MFPIIEESLIYQQKQALTLQSTWRDTSLSDPIKAVPKTVGWRTLFDPDKLQTLSALTFPQLLHTQLPAS